MENVVSESCQTCFRPVRAESSPATTQWITSCRCGRVYQAKSEFSIDVCARCKKRVPFIGAVRVEQRGLCFCESPQPVRIPTYLKPGEADALVLDLASVGLSQESFPVERFTPLATLGVGPRATVVLCRDRQRGTKVAMKCFKTVSTALRSIFESEVRKNKELNHTGIARIVDFGFHLNKSPYLVSEYKDGFDLEQCLALYGTPSHDVAVRVLIDTCEALLYAQKQGVLHRNIKPGNIVFVDDLNAEPSVAVLDFALPRIKADQDLSDPYDAWYISADEARRLEYSEKSEEYSLGCVGFALLTGRAPFMEGDALDIKNSHALKLPPRISNLNFDKTRPKEIEEVVERCLEKDPRYRFDSVAALQERLQVFPRLEQQRIGAILAARKRNKLLAIAAVVIGLIAVSATVLWFVTVTHH